MDFLRSNQHKNLTGAATTTVKAAAGYLHCITFNRTIASATVTIYDNTAASGTLIATITLPATLLNDAPQVALYNVNFKTGLTIVTTGTNLDLTVSYQ